MYFDVITELNAIVRETAESLLGGPLDASIQLTFTPARDLSHGDLATNAAMVLAKPLKKAPKETAEAFCEKLRNHPMVREAASAGPGFVNVRLSDQVLLDTLKTILQTGHAYGRSDKNTGKTALVEFVSANPTGPLHVGHVRGAVVGDVAAELLSAVGYDVTREYYYNDAGVQMQTLGYSIRARYLNLCGVACDFPENGYKGDYIRYIAACLKSANGESLTREDSWEPFTEFASAVLMTVIMDDLKKMRIDFNTTFSEKGLHASGQVKETLEKLAERGATYEQDDAVWLKTTAHGDEKDRVLVKSDGEPTYVTPDIAYHCDKYGRGYDKLVNVMGHDHHSQVERVKIALLLFGYDISNLHYLLNQMVSISRGGEKIKLSTREGQFMTMADMVDELGADVTRYFFAQRSYNAQMVFDWDLAKEQSMENPVYYLQYVHARACSMENKANERGVNESKTFDFDTTPLLGEKEREILFKLFTYPLVVMDAAEKFESHQITAFLEDLAKSFHAYYQVQRVLDQDDPVGTEARFHLVLGVRQVMRNGLGLLKVAAPERM
ncbi:arginine--tRNA ligase [bacterium]|nr:arginine--tRNA ligase [bacterium]